MTITDLLNNQLDYAYFVSGLAFFLVGVCCIVFSRTAEQRAAWRWMAAFAFLYALYDWFKLLEWVLGSNVFLAAFTVLLHASSLLVMMEFNRRTTLRMSGKRIGLWIYPATLLPPLAMALAIGPEAGAITARYIFSGIINLWTASVVWRFAVLHTGRIRYVLLLIGANAVLFFLAAGLIVPKGDFFPASVINEVWFLQTFCMPVQIARMVLAVFMGAGCWVYLAMYSASVRTTVVDNRQGSYQRWVAVLLLALLMFGWMSTERLGTLYLKDLHHDATGELAVMSNRITGELLAIESVSASVSTLPEFVQPLLSPQRKHIDTANAMLTRLNRAANSSLAYLLDMQGTVLAASNHNDVNSLVGNNYAFRPYFTEALGGAHSHYFALGVSTGERGYYAAYPVKDGERMVGVLVIKKALDALEHDLGQYDYSFFTSPDGVIFLSSDRSLLFSTLFPIGDDKRKQLVGTKQFGNQIEGHVFGQQLKDGESLYFKGNRYLYATRTLKDYGWNLALLKPVRSTVVNRFFGILTTLLLTTLTLMFFAAMYLEMSISALLAQQQRELEEANRKLHLQATTDTLTGIFNRLRFNQLLEAELLRIKRHPSPLSVIMFDIDHFKHVNDTYGHQAGDLVLQAVTAVAGKTIRESDSLARWGGEEFMVLTPDASLASAQQLAERIRMAIAAADVGIAQPVTCSFGVAQYRDSERADDFTKRADDALYLAKESGRNRVAVSDENISSG